ncbi:PHP domain-containing protein [Desulfurococcaceae archaeon MEX13E-LK6-19]|nr:PHP domain-containing protein [Desulfurococcaceae archaeon MEX13E-LK6-19]
MHIHTTVSDGRASPYEVVLTAIEKELGIIAITDHNSFRGGILAQEYAKKYQHEIIVIIGNEVRTVHGDVLVYCSSPKNIPNIPSSLQELIDKAHENNCLVVPAHPFDSLRLGIGDLVYELKGWDAIEVFNASANRGANKKAEEAARILGLPGLASSDAHIPEYIGTAYTIIEIDDYSPEGVLEAIRKNKVTPVKRYPPFKYFVKRVLWTIERKTVRALLYGHHDYSEA